MKLIDIIEDFFKHIYPQSPYNLLEESNEESNKTNIDNNLCCPCLLCSIQNTISNFFN
jgi:hypothetical protein